MLVLITAWSVWHIMDNGKLFPEPVSKFVIDFASFPSNVYHTIVPTSVPYNIFDPREITDTTSLDGVQLFSDSAGISPNKFMVSTFNSSKEIEIRLMSFVPNKIYKIWKLNEDDKIKSYFKKITDVNFPARPHHPYMLKDSSIIVHMGLDEGMVSIDKKNKLIWADTTHQFHHSIEPENDSTVWISIRVNKSNHYNIEGFLNDAICALDPRNGKIKLIKPIADIFIENGYQSILDVNYDDDAIHLNDIQPALASSKYWDKGDLLLSIRNRSTIALFRPSNNKIIWLKTGPWLGQHDCDYVDQNTIMVFGNDVIGKKNLKLINGYNDIYFYNFEKDEISKPYTQVMKSAGIKTKTQGRSDLLKNQDLFIDESESGKLYIINKDSVKMIYTERYDKNHIKMFNWVRPVLN